MKTTLLILIDAARFLVGTNARTANTACVTVIASMAFASCATETVTTTKRPDGKETTTVVSKKPTEGLITSAMNLMVGGFLNTFQSKE